MERNKNKRKKVVENFDDIRQGSLSHPSDSSVGGQKRTIIIGDQESPSVMAALERSHLAAKFLSDFGD